MAKKTLLEMVQDILNDLDSDSVNSINDTIESIQVAQIIRSAFDNIIDNRNWPHLRKTVQLDESGVLLKPNYLKIPDTWKELELFRYDKHKLGDARILFQDVVYKEPDAFLRYTSQRDSTSATVTTVSDFSGVKLLIQNNMAPTYWTSFDDQYVVTDSYDSAVDGTLQKSKTQCLAYISPTWVHSDDAIPNLPTEAFTALLEEAKSAAFVTLKQSNNPKAEQRSVKQQKWLARKAWTAAGGIDYPDYGRKGKR